VADALIEVRSEEGPVTVEGLVGPPGVTRATRGSVSTFVNGRWVQQRALAFAVEEAYQGLLMTGRHPLAVLHCLVPPDELDVNVHPRKVEVRLQKEGAVFAVVQRAVRAALVSAAPRAALTSSPESLVSSLGSSAAAVLVPSVAAAPRFPLVVEGNPNPETRVSRLPVLRVVGQLNNTYIIAEGPTGMYLVDQHAAHERVVFEQIVERLEEQDWEQQGLLEPLLVEVPVDEAPLLFQEQKGLARYGLSFEAFGARQLLFRSLPRGIRQGDLGQLLGELAAGLRAKEGWQERLATSMACHSAVRAGDSLSVDQMRALLGELEGCRAPQTCPHGRPTMIHLSVSQLEREFGRRG